MARQNRVDPFGRIHAVAARGLFTGNRGVIHDPDTRTLLKRRWTTKAWIVCALDRGDQRRRAVMGRNGPNGGAGWTELFFLDEVTALAAGHRPCFFCRRPAARRFSQAFAAGQGAASLTAPAMDEILHAERTAMAARATVAPAGLPDGATVADASAVYAKRGALLLPWTFWGYGEPLALAGLAPRAWRLVTPPASVAALRSGFVPEWHPSAGASTGAA